MSRNITLTINEEASTIMQTFANARISLAKEDLRHKKAMKPLKDKKEQILAKRKAELSKGEKTRDEIISMFPIEEIEASINAENVKHADINKPLNEKIEDALDLIPDATYDSYIKKIDNGKRGDFINNISLFLDEIGMNQKEQNPAQVRNFAETLSDKLGSRISNSRTLIEKKKFSSSMSKKQFGKLFLSIFCDILISENAMTIEI